MASRGKNSAPSKRTCDDAQTSVRQDSDPAAGELSRPPAKERHLPAGICDEGMNSQAHAR